MSLITHDPETGPRLVEDDPWTELGSGSVPDSGDVIVTLEQLESIGDVPGRLGVRVDGATDPELLEPHLPRLALIVIEIPKFTDGRAYSLARLLRDRPVPGHDGTPHLGSRPCLPRRRGGTCDASG